MALDKEISALTAAGALDGTELVHGVQGGNSRKLTTAAVGALFSSASRAALSVFGRSANTSGAGADIVAGSDHQVLRRSGTAVGFGAVALNQAAAVTGALPIANGGTAATGAAAARVNVGVPLNAVEAKSSTFTVAAGDVGKVFNVTGTWTMNLLAAATAGNGFTITVTNNGTGVITVDANSTETINGYLTIPLLAGRSAFMVCTGTGWDAIITPGAVDDNGRFLVGHSVSVPGAYTVQAGVQFHGAGGGTPSTFHLHRWQANSSGPVFAFHKSRSATIGSFSATQSGDALGTFFFCGDLGASFNVDSARIAAIAAENFSSTAAGAYLAFFTCPSGTVTLPERMRITDGGLVLVGKTTGSAILDVNGAVRVASYTVATVPSAAAQGAGAIIYVSNESGGAVLAFSDATNWRRVTDRTIIS